MKTNDNYFYVIYLYILFYFYTVGGKQSIDLPKKSVHLTTIEPAKELDTSNSCAACEAFVAVFEDRLTNDSVNADEIDLMELCNEVEVVHKDQVNTTIYIGVPDCSKQVMCNYYQTCSQVDEFRPNK